MKRTLEQRTARLERLMSNKNEGLHEEDQYDDGAIGGLYEVVAAFEKFNDDWLEDIGDRKTVRLVNAVSDALDDLRDRILELYEEY